MTKLFFLFLFFFLIFASAPQEGESTSVFSPVLLPVYQSTFIKIFSGVPGRHITLRIHKECNDTVVLFSLPTSYSKSYTHHDSERGSEIFFLGQHALRLPVFYSNDFLLEEREHDGFAHSFTMHYDGLLCLGPHSHLWNFWTRFSCSSSDLLLGAHDHYLDRISFEPFSDIVGANSEVFCPQINQTYVLRYEPESTMSYLPDELYFYARNNHEHLILRLENGAHFALTHYDFSSRFPQYNFDYATVRRSLTNQIVLGRQPMSKFVWHGNMATHQHQVSLSYDLFDFGNSQPAFNGIIALLLTIGLCFWFAIVYTEDLNDDERAPKALFFMEVFTYVVCTLCLVAEHEGFAVERYLIRHTSSTIYYIPLLVFVGFNVLVGVFTSLLYQTKAHHISFRKSSVETVLLLTLWITQLDNRYSGIEQAFLMFIAAIYTWSRSISFLWHLVKTNLTKQLPQTFSLGIYCLAAHFFLIVYNIIPIVNRFWKGFPEHWGNVLFLWHASSLLVVVHSFIHFVIADVKNNTLEEPKVPLEK